MPDHAMDDQFKVPPGMAIGQLRGRLLHRSFTGLEQLEDKFNRHSSSRARERQAQAVLARRAAPPVRASPFYFLNQYLRRGLWRAGWYGFAVANIAAHGRWLSDARCWKSICANREARTKD